MLGSSREFAFRVPYALSERARENAIYMELKVRVHGGGRRKGVERGEMGMSKKMQVSKG